MAAAPAAAKSAAAGHDGVKVFGCTASATTKIGSYSEQRVRVSEICIRGWTGDVAWLGWIHRNSYESKYKYQVLPDRYYAFSAERLYAACTCYGLDCNCTLCCSTACFEAPLGAGNSSLFGQITSTCQPPKPYRASRKMVVSSITRCPWEDPLGLEVSLEVLPRFIFQC